MTSETRTGQARAAPAREEPIIVIGAGGHAKVVIEALRAMGRTVTGLIAPAPVGTLVLGVPVLGNDSMLPRLRAEGIADAVLGVGDNRVRDALAEHLLALGFDLPPVLHPAAWISPSSVLGAGVVVLQQAAVSAETVFGRAALINSGAVVEHDSEIGGAAHVAPGCALAGHVRVGARTLVGIGSVVRPEIVIGSDAIVGAGSVVVFDVPAGATVMGCPARPGTRVVPGEVPDTGT
jgi:UDP-perosamine 4-acetyltransferase